MIQLLLFFIGLLLLRPLAAQSEEERRLARCREGPKRTSADATALFWEAYGAAKNNDPVRPTMGRTDARRRT